MRGRDACACFAGGDGPWHGGNGGADSAGSRLRKRRHREAAENGVDDNICEGGTTGSPSGGHTRKQTRRGYVQEVCGLTRKTRVASVWLEKDGWHRKR
jgi:hypothetical protein